MPEHKITTEITKKIMDAGNIRGRLWRNNVGMATYQIANIQRRVHYGVGGRGAADLIGFRIMGKIAQFVAIEVKLSKHDKPKDQQKRFLDVIKESGGYAAIAHPDSVDGIVSDLLDNKNEYVV